MVADPVGGGLALIVGVAGDAGIVGAASTDLP